MSLPIILSFLFSCTLGSFTQLYAYENHTVLKSSHEQFALAIGKLLDIPLTGIDLIEVPRLNKSRKVSIIDNKLDVTEHCFFYLSALNASKKKNELSLLQQKYLNSMHIVHCSKINDTKAVVKSFDNLSEFNDQSIRDLGLNNFSVFRVQNQIPKKSLTKVNHLTTVLVIGEGVKCKMTNAAWENELMKIQI